MQQKFSYKSIALFMAFLIFSTSIGFSLDAHFCKNQLESISFFGNVEACEMMQEKQEVNEGCSFCEAPKKEVKSCDNQEVANGNCCHNETFAVGNNGDLEKSTFSFEQFQQITTAVIVLLPNINLFKPLSKQPNYAYYNPPPIVNDIFVLHQVFLI